MDVRGILGIDSDVRNGFSNIKVTYTIDADASAGGHRGAGGAVAEALRRLRHHHQPHQRHRRGRLSRGRAAGSRGSAAMRTTTTVIIGAGHAGLAMSRCLTDRSIDHVLLERGDVASSWSTGRWDSLRLLTPNWQSRLPGHRYTGDDPDGYMTMPEVVGFLRGYAAAIDAPVQTEHRGDLGAGERRRLPRHDHRRSVARPHRGAGQRRLRRARHPGAGGRPPDHRAVDGGRRLPEPRPARARRRPRSPGPRPPASSWPTRSTGPADR